MASPNQPPSNLVQQSKNRPQSGSQNSRKPISSNNATSRNDNLQKSMSTTAPPTGFTKPVLTRDGYEVCNAFPGRIISDAKRYINPKMENELKIFKKKIAARFSAREIVDWYFPYRSEEQIRQSSQKRMTSVESQIRQQLLHPELRQPTQAASTRQLEQQHKNLTQAFLN